MFTPPRCFLGPLAPSCRWFYGQPYRELIAWQQAMGLAMGVYRATGLFPRYSPGEFRHDLGQAGGALVEPKPRIAIAQNLGCMAPECSSRLTPQPPNRQATERHGKCHKPSRLTENREARTMN